MDEMQRMALWDEYQTHKTRDLREKLILEYAPLVKIVAGRLSVYLGGNVEYDDLVGYGIFGLIDAIDKFDISKQAKFETYASWRIKGSILDQIRKMDWIPRTLRQRQRQIEAAIKEVEGSSGRNATDEEVAANLGISIEEYSRWQNQMKLTNVISLDEFLENGVENIPASSSARTTSRFDTPDEVVEKAELKTVLADALKILTEKERQVIQLYYYEELTLKEISNIMEVTESRVSQLHTKALKKMQSVMGEYMGIFHNNSH